MVKYLLISHLQVQNANALSSPFTIGFPAMTAWLGAVHFLEKNLKKEFQSIKIMGVGVISHSFDLQTYKGKGDFVHSIIGTGNPLDKDGKRSSFLEEARCHFDVSLVLEIHNFNPFTKEKFCSSLESFLWTMKFASGDVLSFKKPNMFADDEESQCKLIRSLMPGDALVERRDIMIEAMEEKDALDALLDGMKVSYSCESDGRRKTRGWIVPIATGFHGISKVNKAGETSNQRDPLVPHRFAESVVTLGEFKRTYKFDRVSDFLWRYNYLQKENLYLCENMRPTQNN